MKPIYTFYSKEVREEYDNDKVDGRLRLLVLFNGLNDVLGDLGLKITLGEREDESDEYVVTMERIVTTHSRKGNVAFLKGALFDILKLARDGVMPPPSCCAEVEAVRLLFNETSRLREKLKAIKDAAKDAAALERAKVTNDAEDKSRLCYLEHAYIANIELTELRTAQSGSFWRRLMYCLRFVLRRREPVNITVWLDQHRTDAWELKQARAGNLYDKLRYFVTKILRHK